MRDQKIQELVERDIKGELDSKQEDELWIIFLRKPEWYDYFITYLNLVALTKTDHITKSTINGE